MNKKKKVSRIIVPYGMVTRLAKRFNVSDKTINAALNYVTLSELADSIRKEALKYYKGTEVELNV